MRSMSAVAWLAIRCNGCTRSPVLVLIVSTLYRQHVFGALARIADAYKQIGIRRLSVYGSVMPADGISLPFTGGDVGPSRFGRAASKKTTNIILRPAKGNLNVKATDSSVGRKDRLMVP